jgi:hypothetical protein
MRKTAYPGSAKAFPIWYVEQMYRVEIIAEIDAEIERLQQARFLIAQSAIGKQSNGSRLGHGRVARAGKKPSLTQGSQGTGRSNATGPTVVQEKSPVLIIRVPPKEPRKRRVVEAATKEGTALSGQVPMHPVVVAARARSSAAEGVDRTSSPTSAFGRAITRGLASLGT